MKDFSIQLTHHPGDLARVAQALARKGGNIRALAAVSAGDHAVARIIPDDFNLARRAFRAANIRFEESEVNTVLLVNKPGELATVTHRLGDEGINLEALYVTGITDDLIEIAIVCDDPKKARKVLAEF